MSYRHRCSEVSRRRRLKSTWSYLAAANGDASPTRKAPTTQTRPAPPRTRAWRPPLRCRQRRRNQELPRSRRQRERVTAQPNMVRSPSLVRRSSSKRANRESVPADANVTQQEGTACHRCVFRRCNSAMPADGGGRQPPTPRARPSRRLRPQMLQPRLGRAIRSGSEPSGKHTVNRNAARRISRAVLSRCPDDEREVSASRELSGRFNRGPPRAHRRSTKRAVRLG